MPTSRFLDLPNASPQVADAVLVPCPYEGTVSYGSGTSNGPAAILAASTQVELWDEELDFDLDQLCFYTADAITPRKHDTPQSYSQRLLDEAEAVHKAGPGLLVGLGGEHSITPPLVHASLGGSDDLSELTVVQFDAHSDLRDEYDDTRFSHACAMRRLVERGATVIAIGIRSADRHEFMYGRDSGRVFTYFSQQLASQPDIDAALKHRLRSLDGQLYLTIDVDGLDPAFCPGTGTPQPGGLGWWQALSYLKCLLYDNRQCRLRGCDLVETVPQPHTCVNEFTAARLLCKVLAYRFAARHS